MKRLYRYEPGTTSSPTSHGSRIESGLRFSIFRTAILGGILTGRSQRAVASSAASKIATFEDIVATDVSVEVEKRPSDDREYKAITLDNGMRTLLVSDASTKRSAAAIDVHVGSFSDPDDLAGLAHFAEHMCFLGTKKYPEEDEFSKYLASHGGSSNAYTDSEDTVYYFDCASPYLSGSLDRFSQFFISPLFSDSAISRELNAIDSEHSKNINNDGFRIYQLEKDSANPMHPLNKFSTGIEY